MNDIQIVLLEDDPIDRIKIEIMLSEPILPQYSFRLAGIFAESEALLDYVATHKVDLILSDIYIQNKPVGLELLKRLRDTPIPIVMMTMAQEPDLYAKSQSYRSVHYLIKPFHAISLQSAVSKALEEYHKSKQYDFADKKYLYLTGKTGKRERVLFSDIVYIEAEDSHCYIHTLTKKYALKKSLSKLLAEDLNSYYIRIHHKYAANRSHIQKSGMDTLQLTGQVVLPVGKSFRKELINTLK